VVDADNRVDPAFFAAMNRELEAGGRVLQGYDGLSNPGDTNLTRLMAVTSVMKNLLFYGGKAALGMSTLLMGTGMVFASDALRRHGWTAGSIGEDLEQGLALRAAGERIRFVPTARVLAEEATTLRQGTPQRQRWASGRRALRRSAWRAVARGLRRRSLADLDAGVELLLPTYSRTLYLSAVAAVLAGLLWPVSPVPAALAAIALAAQALEGAAALRLMRADAAFVRSLALAPVFLVWKAGIDLLAAAGFRRSRWTRTDRVPGAPGSRR